MSAWFRSPRAQPALWPTRPLLWYGLALMLVLAAAPHLARLHPLASLYWLGIVAWRLWLGLRQRPVMGVALRLVLLLLAGALLFFQYRTVLGRDAGAALLVMMLALKFFELRNPRDANVLVFLSYFLITVQFLFTQAIPTALYLALAAVVITSVWMECSDPLGGRRPRVTVTMAARMLAQALPLMLVLFVLFPRIPGPLWSLPHDAHSGMTGLSNAMEPGRISNLVNSHAVAFRVEFDGPIPPPPQRYWRGPVFELTDGRRWSPAPQPATDVAFTPQPKGEAIRQTITLEPHGKHSLLALDLPGGQVSEAQLLADFQLRAEQPVLDRIRYQVNSYAEFDTLEVDTESLRRTSLVPNRVSERVRTLASQWREQAQTPLAIVEQALLYFRQQPFVYTLRPPLLGDHPVDEFLFETRRGFCEHYASAFAILMRAAGLPARVVTGYLGGEMNEVGDYMIVRQSDAHAWTEVRLPNFGWIRIDPTSAVAPERVERTIDLSTLREGAPVRFRISSDNPVLRWGQQMRAYWDAANNGWNQWVLGYGPQLQQDFLRGLGLPDVTLRGLIWALAITAGLALALTSFWLLYRPRPDQDPTQRLYQRFCDRLARKGVRRQANEGPLAFGERAARLRPRHAQAIGDITRSYIALRYGQRHGDAALRRLRKLVGRREF